MSELDKKSNISSDTITTEHAHSQPVCPEVPVDCCCEAVQPITFDVCQDTIDFTIGGSTGIDLECESRFLKIRVLLKNVCRGRKIALGVFVCQLEDNEFKIKGFRAREITVPPGEGCCNVRVDNFCFVLPQNDLCRKKEVRVEVVAHYSSFAFNCPC